jgi:hypothetical protein
VAPLHRRLFWLPLLATLACASQPEGSDRVSFQGFHGVRFGMPVKQAVDAYGSRLAPAAKVKNADRDCYYVFPQDDEGLVGFMVAEGQIARIDVTRAGALSADGFGVGSLESEVIAAYGDRVQVSPHKYTGPRGHYLTVEQGERALIYETDGTRVISFRAGRLPEVKWVEGCS